jgi:hypothetical protein
MLWYEHKFEERQGGPVRNHSSTRGRISRTKRAVVALLAALLCTGSTGVATSMASNAGGADKSRPASFGDCKNSNSGAHNGYDCEVEPVNGETEGGIPS